MAGELAIEVRQLVKRFGGRVTAVDRLALSVRYGETYGLLGPNGAGKTTTLRMLLGLVRPTAGMIRVLGLPPGEPLGLRRVGAMGETAPAGKRTAGWPGVGRRGRSPRRRRAGLVARRTAGHVQVASSPPSCPGRCARSTTSCPMPAPTPSRTCLARPTRNTRPHWLRSRRCWPSRSSRCTPWLASCSRSS